MDCPVRQSPCLSVQMCTAGLSGEVIVFLEHPKEGKKDFETSMRQYPLRPEAMESIFILWRVTGDARSVSHTCNAAAEHPSASLHSLK